MDTRETNSTEAKTSGTIEKTERDASWSRNTWKVTSCGVQTRDTVTGQRGTAVKEQRVDDTAMDQGRKDASMTKMRMDEMLMDQVMVVSCGTSHVCVNEDKYEPATIRGLPADLVKKGVKNGQAREMKDLDDMNVQEWVKEPTIPRDAKILDCRWAVIT